MTDWDDNIDSAEQPGEELAGGLDALARALDGQSYPGRAWIVPTRRRVLRRLIVPAAGAAAAAAVVAAVVLWRPARPPETPAPVAATQPVTTQVASAPPRSKSTWTVPGRMDVSLAGRFTLTIPKIKMPSGGEAGGFAWDVPTISFPSSPRWTKDKSNEKQDDSTGTDGAGGGGGSGGAAGPGSGPRARRTAGVPPAARA